MSRPRATPSRPRAAPSRPARTSRRASRIDQGLHPGRPGAAAGDHAGRPRRRRLGADLDGQGRQAREGRRWFQAYRDVIKKHLAAAKPAKSLKHLSMRQAGGRAIRSSRERSLMLAINNIEVIYDGVILVLKGVSLDVARRARSRRCSAPTAPARRRRSRRSPACCAPSAARSPRARSQLDGQRIDGMRAARGDAARHRRRCSRAAACSST